MKRTVELTPHQVMTWLAVLGVFEVAIVNRALVEIGLSADPFPDLGKIVQKCEAIRKEATTYSDNRLPTPSPLIQRVAEVLRLKINIEPGQARGVLSDTKPKD